MTTNRFDHTDCSHDTTPAGRKLCRSTRRRAIRDAQAMYMAVMADPNFEGQNDYEATVDIFAMRYGMALRDAYTLIENGPCVY